MHFVVRSVSAEYEMLLKKLESFDLTGLADFHANTAGLKVQLNKNICSQNGIK